MSRKHPENSKISPWDYIQGGKCTHPFTVDRHLCIGVDAEVRNLWDITNTLHISRITSGTEDTGNTSVGFDIV